MRLATRRRATSTLVAALLGAATLSACGGEPDGLVASPPPDADPVQVVQALVDAINARDQDLVDDLSTPAFAASVEQTWMDGGYLTEAEIGETVEGQGIGTAHPDAVGVMVSFVPEGTDASIPDGERVTWAFLVTDDDGPWLVFDAGAG